MTNKHELLFSIQEVCIYPKSITTIESRKECDPTINGKLPLFTAPMSTVIDEQSVSAYEKCGINVIIPRTVSLQKRVRFMETMFAAFGLSEIEEYVKANKSKIASMKKAMILIDIANGHMQKMHEVIKRFKSEFGSKMIIMCGNIANPKTYRYLSEAGADYIRCGIGGGSGCLTASNTGVFYPMGSLIIECRKIQKEMEKARKDNKTAKPAYIIADGGMKNYDYINKALFIGADYAMCGRIFSQSWEAPGQKWCKEKTKSDIFTNWNKCDSSSTYDPIKYDYKKIFYGMSTKIAQKEISCANNEPCGKFKTSEGVAKTVPILYQIEGWTENFLSYLTSAMSYTNCRTLQEVKEFDNYSIMTYAAHKSYNQ